MPRLEDLVTDLEFLRRNGSTIAGLSAQELAQLLASDMTTELSDSFVPAFVVDAATYGNGSTNARAAIQAKLDACSAAGGGTVFLPEGTYMVDMAGVPGFSGYYAGLVLPSGVVLRGAGERVTTIKLIANEPHDIDPDGASIIYNADLDGSGDTDLGVMDLTVDGNAANQTNVHNGITMIRTRRARFTRVTVKNVRGTASSGTQETFHFETQLGMDTTYTDCTVFRDAGTTASGFSADNATGVHYSNCLAYGMTNSMGFTHHLAEEIHYANCHAFLNGVNGFNSEESRDVTYVGCHAGGEVASGTTPWPLAAGTTLGNTASGFVINGTKNALLAACTSRENATGITLVEGTAGASGRIVGCAFVDNSTAGVSCSNATTFARWAVDSSIVLNNNGGSTEYDLPSGWTDDPQTLPWVEPSVGTGWTIQGTPYEVPRYRKLNGVTYIEGLVLNNSGGALGATDEVFTLPAGFRPRAIVNAVPFSAAGLEVAPTGEVRVNNSIPNSTFLSLTISFVAEQ